MNKKILIVEDDINLGVALKEGLEENGFDVIVAGNGEQGLAVLEKEKIDFIVLDILMPKMNGIEMAGRVKKQGIKIPMIFLSNLSNMESISTAEEAMPADYFLKTNTSIEKIVKNIKNKIANG